MRRHKITVVVPVYNAERYLKSCLRSLAGQTIRKRELEVLLVNDGSTDGSEAVCRRFCEKHSWVRLVSQANAGPSAARNLGIGQATGRYIMYLDADDTLSSDSVRAVRNFFAAHEDEVDLVTYPLVQHRNDRRMPRHWRYSYITKTGVYDCGEKPFFAQGSINVCVRNRGEDNILFEQDRYHHEDETYVTANIARRWRFGFAADAEYRYNKDNDGSIVATKFHAYYIFEENTAWFEQLFAAYPSHVPLYLQGLLINDIEWKLRGGLLFPWHYDGEAFDHAAARLRALLRRVDPQMIAGHPQMSEAQKAFWLEFTQRAISKEDLPEAIRKSVGVQVALHARKRRPPRRRVWLYYDPYLYPARDINAYFQFQHDCAKDDGVRRYFLLRDTESAARFMFRPGQRQYLIPRGGVKHLLAYLRCEWILTSELSLEAVSPFRHKKLERLAERLFLRRRLVYLQGGVHQFAGPDELYAESGLAEKVVVSAPAEFECFRDKYGYNPEQLIPAGLARYDALDRSAARKGSILFAPDWRKYLMHNENPARKRVQASDYYKNFHAFLDDPALASLLEEHQMTLDVHLHPKLDLIDLFAVECQRVRLVNLPPEYTRFTSYDACITDISSIAYDFAYLGRYVQYFLPDGPQFRAGMHEYRVFDLPQAFGPHSETPEEALAQLKDAARRGFAPEKAYKERMQDFFYSMENGREQVYRAVMGK